MIISGVELFYWIYLSVIYEYIPTYDHIKSYMIIYGFSGENLVGIKKKWTYFLIIIFSGTWHRKVDSK